MPPEGLGQLSRDGDPALEGSKPRSPGIGSPLGEDQALREPWGGWE